MKAFKNSRFFGKDKVIILFSNDQDETNLTNFTSYPWAEMLIKCLLSKSYSELKLELQAAFKGLSLQWPIDTCRHLPTPADTRCHPPSIPLPSLPQNFSINCDCDCMSQRPRSDKRVTYHSYPTMKVTLT